MAAVGGKCEHTMRWGMSVEQRAPKQIRGLLVVVVVRSGCFRISLRLKKVF
jgi:hypothetical protein